MLTARRLAAAAGLLASPPMPAAASIRAAWPWAVAAALVALFLIEAASIRGKSLTYDAPVHLRYGLQVLHGDTTRFDDSKMPVSAWNALPMRVAEGLEPGPVREFLAADGTARYPTMVASLVLAWLVFRWSRELYGLGAGFLSLTLHLLDPNLLAHSRFVTTDLYAALTVALALYTFWRFLGSDPGSRARRGWGVAAALAFGLAQVAKYSGAYLAPVLLLVAALRHLPALAADLRSRSWRRLGARLGASAAWCALFAAGFLLVVHAAFLFQDSFHPLAEYRFRSEPFRELQTELTAVWPPSWPALRVPAPYPYVQGLDWVLSRERSGTGYGDIYLLGETRRNEGFAGYFVIASLYKVPLPTQVVWLAAAVVYAAHVSRRKGGRPGFDLARDGVLLLVPIAFFAVYFNVFFRAQMGIRYFLPVFPLLHVFAGCLLAPPVWGELRRGARARLAAVGALLGIWLAASVLSYYPHLLPYMNELLPERRLAYRVLSDSNLDWGQDIDAVERYLAENPEVVWQPDEPTAGRILVGTNWLTGVFAKWGVGDTWIFGRFEPVGHFRYSHLFFEVSEEDAARVRGELEREPP